MDNEDVEGWIDMPNSTSTELSPKAHSFSLFVLASRSESFEVPISRSVSFELGPETPPEQPETALETLASIRTFAEALDGMEMQGHGVDELRAGSPYACCESVARSFTGLSLNSRSW